uniref:Uncharacterized protein n=1 Tax=Micrurus corallinus TaxID=54390 RepID=A0A2D4FWK8_MICCO
MTSVPSLTKIGNKASSTPTAASSSPSKQRSIDVMLQEEKTNTFQKEIQMMFQSIQEAMTKNHEMKNDLGEMKEAIQNMNVRLKNCEQMITKNEQRIQKVEEKLEEA